jgi:hypothetical protein
MCKECNDTKIIIVNRGPHRTEIPCPLCQTTILESFQKVDTPESKAKCEWCGNPTWLTREGNKIETWCEHCIQNHVHED